MFSGQTFQCSSLKFTDTTLKPCKHCSAVWEILQDIISQKADLQLSKNNSNFVFYKSFPASHVIGSQQEGNCISICLPYFHVFFAFYSFCLRLTEATHTKKPQPKNNAVLKYSENMLFPCSRLIIKLNHVSFSCPSFRVCFLFIWGYF